MGTIYADFLTSVLTSASQIAVENFGRVSATVKSEDKNQVVTVADLKIARFIIDEICRAYPGHNIIDEESGVIDNNSRFTWVVDPIDGTSNFAAGLPLYGIMVGLLDDGFPVAGGIGLPAFSEIYVAESSRGAFCNGKRISVIGETNLGSTLVAYGIDGHQENPDFTIKECELLARIVLHIRNLRTSNSVYDAAMVAKGKYGAVLNRTSRIWDNVAQQVVIEEAGGLYTDFFGAAVDYSRPLNKVKENFTLCAAPPTLHEQIQRIIRDVT
jgi:myo-inositol-1(or 4)-monophosphatase